MTTPCCKAILIPCPKCESPAGERCTKPSRYSGVVRRGECHVARSNAFVKVCALLDAPAMLQEYPVECAFYSPPLHFQALRDALMDMVIRIHAPIQTRVRVSLLDGTVIREWIAVEACDVCKQPIKDYGCDCMPF